MANRKIHTYDQNPRKITTQQTADLKQWYDELGELGCITYNITNNQFVSGNQRSGVIDFNSQPRKVVKKLKRPDKQGTVEWGFLETENGWYPYRAVKWDQATHDRAAVIANKAGGTFDFEILQLNFSTDQLGQIGFQSFELPTIVTDAELDGFFQANNSNAKTPKFQIVLSFAQEREHKRVMAALNKFDDTNLEQAILKMIKALPK